MKSSGLARIGRDVELKRTSDNTAYCQVSLAVNYMHKREKCTQWIDGTLWGQRAESLAQWLSKGNQVVVYLSDLHEEKFTKADGTPGAKLAARIDDIELTDRKDAGQGQAPVQAAPPRQQAAPAPRPQAAPAASGFDAMDDDIPF